MSKLDLKIRSKIHAGQFREIILTLKGRLDKKTLQKFENELGIFIESKPQRVVLETATLHEIHGDALEFLAGLHRNLKMNSGELIITNRHEVVESTELEIRELDGVWILKVLGHLDIRGVGKIEEDFLKPFENLAPLVAIDFSATDSISSLGIRMLLQGIKTSASRGGRTLVINPSPTASASLEVAGFGHFIARGDEVEILEGLRNR